MTDLYVCELSSFNLQYSSPHSLRAAITSITPNHLNWHASFDEYRLAKMNILTNTDFPVLSADDKECAKIIQEYGAGAVFSTRECYSSLSKKYSAEKYYTCERGWIYDGCEPIIPTGCLPRSEEYNIRNLMCAIAMARSYVTDENILRVASDFRGLPHRCEHFHESCGIQFINSSIDTSPMRTAATLNALGKRVKIILGGRGKCLSYEPLRAPLSAYAEKIAVYGDASEEIMSFLNSDANLSGITKRSHDSFVDAVHYVTSDLAIGDTVILSPACTSYGEFGSFEERGDLFKSLILNRFK
jgi:UDP-N-acetylmuramoylalanine--D-glutamate ligase